MKRNILVAGIVIVALAVIGWAGVENYRQRQVAQQKQQELESQRVELVPVGPRSTDATTADAAKGDASMGPEMVNKAAPEFNLATPDGGKLSLTALRKQHKALMVNFWATWCVPCKVEMPWLVELEKQYAPQGLEIVGVSEDDPPDAADKVKKYTAKVGAGYPMVLDDGSAVKSFDVQDFPTSFYISADGKVVAQSVGLVGRDEIEANMRKALGGK